MAAPPSSQKADRRPISFVLDDGETIDHVKLFVRPEDLTRNEPSLMTPTQTFNGVFIDDFGRGLSTIQISGHTGWRGGNDADGVAGFIMLRDRVFLDWHDKRKAAVGKGKSPDTVKLIFADALDTIVVVVAPTNFTLKRSKSRPLLMMYSIGLTIVSERLDERVKDELFKLSGLDDSLPAGVDSLTGSAKTITDFAAKIRAVVAAGIATPIHNFLNVTTQAMNSVLGAVGTVTGVLTAEAQQFAGIAADLAQVGRNAFYTLGAVAGLPALALHDVVGVAAAFENAFCVLRNAFNGPRLYADYTGLYGASNCSSTVGGSPLSPYAGINPFEVITPSVSLPPTISADAAASMAALRATDPVLAPMTLSDLVSHMGRIGSGVTF